MSNDACFAIFGCNSGFFGYDAFRHFVSGAFGSGLLILIMRNRPRFNLLPGTFYKDIVILVAIVALGSVLWEIGEFTHDHYRIDVLHEDIALTNHLDQPTNSDTMGDMTFSLLGAFSMALALKKWDGDRNSFK